MTLLMRDHQPDDPRCSECVKPGYPRQCKRCGTGLVHCEPGHILGPDGEDDGYLYQCDDLRSCGTVQKQR